MVHGAATFRTIEPVHATSVTSDENMLHHILRRSFSFRHDFGKVQRAFGGFAYRAPRVTSHTTYDIIQCSRPHTTDIKSFLTGLRLSLTGWEHTLAFQCFFFDSPLLRQRRVVFSFLHLHTRNHVAVYVFQFTLHRPELHETDMI
jgi:hypothetical protein